MSFKVSVVKANVYAVLRVAKKLKIAKANIYVVSTVPGKLNIAKAVLYTVSTVPGKINLAKAVLYTVSTVPGKLNIAKAVLYTVSTVPGKINITKAVMYVIAMPTIPEPDAITPIEISTLRMPVCPYGVDYKAYITSFEIKQIPNEIIFKTNKYTFKRPERLLPVYNISMTISDIRLSHYLEIQAFYDSNKTTTFFYFPVESVYYRVRFLSYKVSHSDLRERYNISFSLTGVFDRYSDAREPSRISDHDGNLIGLDNSSLGMGE